MFLWYQSCHLFYMMHTLFIYLFHVCFVLILTYCYYYSIISTVILHTPWKCCCFQWLICTDCLAIHKCSISGIFVRYIVGSKPRLSQTNDYKYHICCFTANHAKIRSKSKEYNYDIVSEWSDISIRGLLF